MVLVVDPILFETFANFLIAKDPGSVFPDECPIPRLSVTGEMFFHKELFARNPDIFSHEYSHGCCFGRLTEKSDKLSKCRSVDERRSI